LGLCIGLWPRIGLKPKLRPEIRLRLRVRFRTRQYLDSTLSANDDKGAPALLVPRALHEVNDLDHMDVLVLLGLHLQDDRKKKCLYLWARERGSFVGAQWWDEDARAT
jgi:hypothetical protein